MLACHRLFGQERGEQIMELVERVSGDKCPCLVGTACPLLSSKDRPSLVQPYIKPLPAQRGTAAERVG